jgi:hypothetical protein
MDDLELWSQVVEAATASGVSTGGELDIARKLSRYLDYPATELVRALAPPEMLIRPGDLAHRLDVLLQVAHRESS